MSRAKLDLTSQEYVTLMVGLTSLRIAIEGGVRVPEAPPGVPDAITDPIELNALAARISKLVVESMTS